MTDDQIRTFKGGPRWPSYATIVGREEHELHDTIVTFGKRIDLMTGSSGLTEMGLLQVLHAVKAPRWLLDIFEARVDRSQAVHLDPGSMHVRVHVPKTCNYFEAVFYAHEPRWNGSRCVVVGAGETHPPTLVRLDEELDGIPGLSRFTARLLGAARDSINRRIKGKPCECWMCDEERREASK